jgi:hypothetical protein
VEGRPLPGCGHENLSGERLHVISSIPYYPDLRGIRQLFFWGTLTRHIWNLFAREGFRRSASAATCHNQHHIQEIWDSVSEWEAAGETVTDKGTYLIRSNLITLHVKELAWAANAQPFILDGCTLTLPFMALRNAAHGSSIGLKQGCSSVPSTYR